MTPSALKAIRARLRLTQRTLANRLGVTPNTVARWEQGVHRISPLASRLIRALMKGDPLMYAVLTLTALLWLTPVLSHAATFTLNSGWAFIGSAGHHFINVGADGFSASLSEGGVLNEVPFVLPTTSSAPRLESLVTISSAGVSIHGQSFNHAFATDSEWRMVSEPPPLHISNFTGTGTIQTVGPASLNGTLRARDPSGALVGDHTISGIGSTRYTYVASPGNLQFVSALMTFGDTLPPAALAGGFLPTHLPAPSLDIIPEPATWALLLTGLLGLFVKTWRDTNGGRHQ